MFGCNKRLEMRLWHGILLIMMLTLTLPIVGCGESSKDTDLQNYLTQGLPLVLEFADASQELQNIGEDFAITKNTDRMLLALTEYSEKYDDILSRFKAIEVPKDAVKHSEYTIDMIYYAQAFIDEMSVLLTTQDSRRAEQALDRAISYAAASDESRLLAMDESIKLDDMARQGNGIDHTQNIIVTTILIVIVAIGAGIWAIVKKVKGAMPRSD